MKFRKYGSFALIIWIPLFLSSCTSDGTFSVNTGFDFASTLSIQLTFDSNDFSATNETNIKLYYMHQISDTSEIIEESYSYRFNLEIYEYGDNTEPLIIFDQNLTSSELFQAENYVGKTSTNWFFAKPIYNSFFEVKYSFSRDNLNKGRIQYNLFVIDEEATQLDLLTAECQYEIVDSLVHLS